MPKEASEKRDAARAAPKRVRGVVGVVENIFEIWDARREELGLSWRSLAEDIGYSHTYVIGLTEKDPIPEGPFRQMCELLDLDPDELMRRPTEEERSV